MEPTVVAIIGPGSPDDGPVAAAAERCGALLARAGATVVTGGLGGAMAAASRGAWRAGGLVVAVLPGTDRRAATAEATVTVCTGVGEARDLAVVASADAVIAVGGGWGTLAEIGLARKLGRPVVLLESWTATPPGADAGLAEGCTRASSPEQAVDRALGRAP